MFPEAESDSEINLEEHRRRLHHVSQVKEATVCHVPLSFLFIFCLNQCNSVTYCSVFSKKLLFVVMSYKLVNIN